MPIIPCDRVPDGFGSLTEFILAYREYAQTGVRPPKLQAYWESLGCPEDKIYKFDPITLEPIETHQG